MARPVVDILATGFRKFHGSSLATFNKKLAMSQPQIDEIAPCQVVESADVDMEESELSLLHDD
jgi:hypothetical protein